MSDNDLNIAYQEICRLKSMLEEAGIPHRMDRLFDGWHIKYPGPIIICSVIEHRFSTGHRSDRLEIRGLLNVEERRIESTVGFLTADNVFARIRADWERRRERGSKMESGRKTV